MKEITRFSLRLPKELADKLKRLAEKENRSLNGQIVELLERATEGSDE